MGPTVDPNQPALIQLTPEKTRYGIGETVTLQMRISNASNVASIPFHVLFDDDVVDFGVATEGTFLNSDGATTVFLASELGIGGEIVVGASRFGSPNGVSGQGLVAEFTFQTTGAGPCEFQFTAASLKDPLAQNLDAVFNSARILVFP